MQNQPQFQTRDIDDHDHEDCVYAGGIRKVTVVAVAVTFLVIGLFSNIFVRTPVDLFSWVATDIAKDTYGLVTDLIKDKPDKYQEQILADALEQQRLERELGALTEEMPLTGTYKIEADINPVGGANKMTVTPIDPNAYPSQERLGEIYDEMYAIADELKFWDTALLFDIVNHESEFRQYVRNDVDECSRGLFQINCHPKAHPEVTDAQAFSVDWSTRWAIKAIQDEQEWKEWYNTMLKIEDGSL